MELGASSEKTEKPVEDERQLGPIVVGKGRLRVIHGHWWRQGVKWRDSISGSALVYPHYPGWITAHPNSRANSRASPTPAHGGGITSGKLITIHTGWLATVLFLLLWGLGDTTEYSSSWKGWKMHMGHVLLMKGPSGSSGAPTITSESFYLKIHPLSSLPATSEKKKKIRRITIQVSGFDPPFQVWITAEVADIPRWIWDHRGKYYSIWRM